MQPKEGLHAKRKKIEPKENGRKLTYTTGGTDWSKLKSLP